MDALPGHLFVLQGDLTSLACDVVVVPTSLQLEVTSSWLPLVPGHPGLPSSQGWYRLSAAPPPGWGREVRAFWWYDAEDRQVWLARTDGWGQGVEVLAETLRQAVAGAAARGPRTTRARPLVGVPLPGVGAGGYDGRQGDVIDVVVPALQRAAADAQVDVALVLYDAADVVAVQAVREWSPTARERTELAVTLAHQVAEHELVLFLGAGVSVAAGLPGWSELLDELAVAADVHDLDLPRLDVRDAAEVVRRRLGSRFQELMQQRFTLQRYALAHGLLASLRVASVVTTNYDNGYELAAERPLGRDLRVLPRERAEPGKPWLLKMHGDVVRPESIVLTRSDYVDYDEQRAPLTGLVQALLLTRHMLFVGFSLQDDNFARLAHQVRRTLREADEVTTVGTVLTLREEPERKALWEQDLTFHAMRPRAVDGPPGSRHEQETLEAARELEIFLDRLLYESTRLRAGSERYLLDARYEGLPRADAEKAVRAQLRQLQQQVAVLPGDSGVRRRVQQLLADLGG